VGVENVGTGILNFRDAASGTLIYTIDGIHGSKSLQRQLIE
jgi:hypothetical protein